MKDRMTRHIPAVAPAALQAAARKKTLSVQRKLEVAENELHRANEVLAGAIPRHDEQQISSAVQDNLAAEEKVREAAEELHIVQELLADEAQTAASKAIDSKASGASGQGVRSLIPNLSRGSARPST